MIQYYDELNDEEKDILKDLLEGGKDNGLY